MWLSVGHKIGRMFESCPRGAKRGANRIREAGSIRNFVPVGGAQPPASLSARDAGSAQIDYFAPQKIERPFTSSLTKSCSVASSRYRMG
jgi:hypothetical protein